jgi:hypothetical protein
MPSKVPINNAMLQGTLDLNDKSAENIDSAQVFRIVNAVGSDMAVTPAHIGCHLVANSSNAYVLNITNDSSWSIGSTFIASNYAGQIGYYITSATMTDQTGGNSALPGSVYQFIKVDTNNWVIMPF